MGKGSLKQRIPCPQWGTGSPDTLVGYSISLYFAKKSNFYSQATDKDDPGTNNSHLFFEIMPGPFSRNFTIDSNTGVLSSRGSLDREAIPMELEGKVVVTVLVHDLGVPQLNTTVNVTIIVEVITFPARNLMGKGCLEKLAGLAL